MKKYLLSAILFLSLLHGYTQVNDAQFWENINVEKDLNPKINIRIIQQGRLTENWTRPSYNYFDMGASYKMNKHLHISLAYVWAEKRQLNDNWSPRHQVYGSLTFRGKYKDISMNDRQMVLWQVQDFDSSPTGTMPDYYLRNKLTLRYDRYFKYAPYIAEEIYFHLNSPQYVRYRFDRLRIFAGLFYRPDRSNEFEAYYLVEKHLNEADPHTNWVTGLGYTHSF